MEECMTNEEMNLLPGKIKNGELTSENAVWKLLTEVYFNPRRFIDSFMEDDTRSNFITHIQPKIKKVIERYNPEICPFSAYFYVYIYNAFYSWRRSLIRETQSKKILNESAMQLYEEKCEQYTQNESQKSLEPSPSITESSNEEEHHIRRLNKGNGLKKILNTTPLHPKGLLLQWSSKNFIQKKTTIMALKACYYIHDEQLREICKTCKCDLSTMQQKIDFLRKGLESKAERRENFIRRRDNAYFFHKKYALLLQEISLNSPCRKSLLKKYIRHTESWKLKNDMLQNNRFRICPSNKLIAKILGISERQVSYYIAAAKANCSNLTFVTNYKKVNMDI